MLFVVDFDGTLSVTDSVDALLARFAAPRWRAIEKAWREGAISAVTCMERQLRLVRADAAALDAFFRTIQLDAGFLPFHRHVSRFARVAIVSDGLDRAIETALRVAGWPSLPVFANTLAVTEDGLAIGWPHRRADCAGGNGVCKCAVAREQSAPGEPVVLVGDGRSDVCLARHADVVFAKGSLAEHCARHGIAHHPFETFADVLAEVERWPQGRRLARVA
jgi:2,3-diketo-5-methylthio-1-phosphopentane phosphatase